jgi:hypothetical protein
MPNTFSDMDALRFAERAVFVVAEVSREFLGKCAE